MYKYIVVPFAAWRDEASERGRQRERESCLCRLGAGVCINIVYKYRVESYRGFTCFEQTNCKVTVKKLLY